MEILYATLIVGALDLLVYFVVSLRKKRIGALKFFPLFKKINELSTDENEVKNKPKRFRLRRTLKKKKADQKNSIEQGFINMLKFK